MRKFLHEFKGPMLSLLMLLTIASGLVQAQGRIVSGNVKDSKGEAIPGVNIQVKGTSNGTISGSTGDFQLSVESDNDVLVFSFVGFEKQEIQVGSKTTIEVVLADDVSELDEIVVVGYGEQKKSVVTGAITKVSGESLNNVPNGRIETALQGRVAGVTISQNSGQPGSSSTIRVRGVTTFGNNNPLWVVDGVVVDAGGIGYLNQSDIESIEVLKDATSSAIYGTRAAPGVILVTTKKGKSGKFTIDYNGFIGTSAPARKLDLLNATQYGYLMNERAVNDGNAPIFADPSALGAGTDWQSTIFNNSAVRTNHQLGLQGGNDKSSFFVSFGYQNDEGIVASKISNYEKYNVRLNSSHKISKFFTLSQTLGYTHTNSKGLGNTNSEYGGPLSSAINLDPLTPVYETDPVKLDNPSYYPKYSPGVTGPAVTDDKGNVFGISGAGVQEMSNPLAYIQTRLGQKSWDDNLVGNFNIDLNINEDLKFTSVASGKLSFWGGEGFNPYYYLGSGGGLNQPRNSLYRNVNNASNWNIENYLTYSKSINEHNFSLLLGQGAYVSNLGGGNSMTLYDLPTNDYREASFGFYTESSEYVASAYGTEGNMNNNWHKLSSLFGRVNYNYKEKYMLTAILRRDGSNRFGDDKKFGLFPGASVGWNISQEAFWPQNEIVDFLKLKGGFGVTGNDGIRDYGYLSLVPVGFNYTIGNNVVNGYAPASLDNPGLGWETTNQINAGLETTLIGGVDLSFDYYMKKTSGILRPVTIPGYVGVSESPVDNVADMQNSGIELELKYTHKIGPVDFTGAANFATLKNTVTYVNSDVNFITGDASFQGMGTITRTQVDQSYNSFYGYQTAGVFQNQAEIAAYTNAEGELIQPNAQPGDFRWVDVDGDGQIRDDDTDKTFLGTNLPTYSFGVTLSFAYQGFDLMIFANGAGGNKVFQGVRRLDIGMANYSTAVLGRWVGDGTSDTHPRLTSDDTNRNYSRMSDFYLEDGDYLRLKIMQLGYSFKKVGVLSKIGVAKLRPYISAENLVTFTKYTGFDPEVGGNVMGIDKGQYPQARSFLFGLQAQF
jgi:TonB-dependent starch-binding outer membrane protein SusC